MVSVAARTSLRKFLMIEVQEDWPKGTLPRIRLQASPVSVACAGHRSTEGLTGNRTAGAIGCLPLEVTLRADHKLWQMGYPVAAGIVLTPPSYVNNVYSAGISFSWTTLKRK